MFIGQLSLTPVPPEKREQFMQHWLKHAKNKILDCFPNLGYVCGVHTPPAHLANPAKQTRTIELVCGGPYFRIICQLVSESSDMELWRVEMFHKSAFSVPILAWPGAVGALVGYGVGRSIYLALCTLFGWSKTSDWEYMRSALVEAMTPTQVQSLAKRI